MPLRIIPVQIDQTETLFSPTQTPHCRARHRLATGEGMKVEEMDFTTDFETRLPEAKRFGVLDLSGDQSTTLYAVESERR